MFNSFENKISRFYWLALQKSRQWVLALCPKGEKPSLAKISIGPANAISPFVVRFIHSSVDSEPLRLCKVMVLNAFAGLCWADYIAVLCTIRMSRNRAFGFYYPLLTFSHHPFKKSRLSLWSPCRSNTRPFSNCMPYRLLV